MNELKHKRILFHLGCHKTASSALQSFMRGNAPTRGISYFGPEHTRSKGSVLNKLDCVEMKPRGLRPIAVADELTRLFAAQEARDIVVSEENLLGRMPVQSTRLYGRLDYLTDIMASLSRRGASLSGLILIREQTSLLQSAYLFRVARGLTKSPSQVFERLEQDRFSWRRVLEELSLPLEDFLVIPYDSLRATPETVFSSLREFHPIFAELDAAAMPKSNTAFKRLPLFVIQQLLAHGLTVPGGTATRHFVRDLQRHLATLGERPSREALISGAHEALQQVLYNWPEGTGVVTTAIDSYLEQEAQGNNPLSFAPASTRDLRRRYLQDNRRAFDTFVSEPMPARWLP